MTEARDVLVTRNVSVSCATKHLNKVSSNSCGVFVSVTVQCFLETLNTMVTLHNMYLRSKHEKNIFQRYNQLRNMIKVDQ